MGYSSAVVVLIQLAMVPALANAWGLAQYGQWLLLATVPSFLAASDFGFGSAAGNRLIGEVARGDTGAARATFQTALALTMGCSAAVFGLVFVVAMVLPGHFLAVSDGMDADEARLVLIVLSAYGIISLQAALFIAVMRAHGAFALSATFQTTVQLLEGLAVIFAALSGGSPAHAAFAYLLVRSFGTAGHVFLARSRADWLEIGFKHASVERLSVLWRPALAVMVVPLARSGYLQGSAIAVGAAAGADVVPIFTSLRTLSRAGLSFIFAVNKPILPEFTAEHARHNGAWLQKVTGAVVSFNLIVGLCAAITMAILGNSLLGWWTNGAIQAPPPMIYLTAAALLAGAVWEPMSVFLIAVNRHERFTYAFAASTCVSVALTYFFVLQWGVTGASAASLLLESMMVLCALLPLRALTGPFTVSPGALWAVAPERWRRKLSD